MAHKKTCAICNTEYIVSRFDRQDPYVCQKKDCQKFWKSARGQMVMAHKTKYHR